ncbi:SDR family oxidoreductase [Rhizobium sophorae]|uniref:SDR family oxidoreductase n=1 Tax=Rhizobium sophorae TaxID=1535242 RepID=A0A7Y3S8B8_9HYPH|nr:SDR family oxidoreductase [Rhizobium sophorae]MBX4861605.1 SDR family oxidoreductase [Rhizobium bangladeshense]NKK69832.1 SDR family NAD(P)-dependent oxidoreductase [Rhizobium leguminosarum bv. viciae]NNU38450.1 SDR family oxidoreductase [Rhizobium sophorae]
MIQEHKGTALVTGASSGIGAVYAHRLAKQGYDLIIVARNGERLKALASGLTEETGRTVETVVADLGNTADLARVEGVLKQDRSITLLVNNAGVGGTAPLLAADVDKMQKMIELNVTALMRLTYAAVPGFVARGGGTIINIASIVAIAPERLNGVYGATKAFVLAFSQSLKHELTEKNIRIQAVLPGATATEFWGIAGTPIEHLPNEIVMSAEDMVDASLAGLKQGEFATIPALEDAGLLSAYEQARQALIPHLSRSLPAKRYKLA